MHSFLAKIVLTVGLISGGIGSATAQIQVGSQELPVINSASRLTDAMLRELKGTTTLFVLLDHDYEQIDAYQQAIERVWKYTPFKIIQRSEMGNYLEEGKYSFGMFGGYINRSTNMTTVQLTYDLIMLQFNRKGEVNGMKYFSRMVLSPDAKTMNTAALSHSPGFFGIGGKERRRDGIEKLYEEGKFYDWTPGFLMGKLQFVNKLLTAGEKADNFDYLVNKEALAGLRRDTLFIPDYVNIDLSPYTLKTEREMDDDDIKKDYPYKIQFISTHALNDRIMSSDKPVYYLISTLTIGNKFINIYHTKKGRLYAQCTQMSNKFKTKDLKKIAKLIKD